MELETYILVVWQPKRPRHLHVIVKSVSFPNPESLTIKMDMLILKEYFCQTAGDPRDSQTDFPWDNIWRGDDGKRVNWAEIEDGPPHKRRRLFVCEEIKPWLNNN